MQRPQSHRSALFLMILVSTLWSMAGIFTRQLESIQGYEIVFWRSLFTALFIAIVLGVQKRGQFLATFFNIGWLGWLSGIMWAVIFSCFILALTMTTVANTLVMGSITPLLTAFLAWVFLKQKIQLRTWIATVFTAASMIWMFYGGISDMGGTHLAGMVFALIVPIAYSINYIIFGKTQQQADMIPTILIGGVLSALIMLPLSFPFEASTHNIVILIILGVFQLGLPCVLLIYAAQFLQPPEIALLSLLEVLLGPLWVWIGAGEMPSYNTLTGGTIILLCLFLHEMVSLLQSRWAGKNTYSSEKNK